MKKDLLFLRLAALFLIFILYSCNKDKKDIATSQGKIQFSLTISNNQQSSLKSASDSTVSNVITAAVVTIEDASGNIVQNSVSIPITNMNGSYISNPVSLVTGNYQLTEFLLVNQNNQVVYASPLKSSQLAYLVSNPLPITFSIQTNTVTNIIPEVINALNYTPQDFGYATFSFSIDSTFNFLVGAFVYDSTAKDYQLTTASISIYSDSTLVYSGQLSALKNNSPVINTPYDSLGVTNKITLPAKYNSYTINISKLNYVTYKQAFTKSQLRLYYRSTDKGPLVVILKNGSSPIQNDGLVLYLKMKGDVLDYSGYGNNGTAYGTLTPTADHNGNPNAAYYFNGTDSYVEVPDAPSLNPTTQISISVWFCPVSFVGTGNDPIIDKPFTSFALPAYQYHFGVTGNDYWNLPSKIGFDISTNNILGGAVSPINFYQPGNWYHLVGTYDGSYAKLYVNGALITSNSTSGTLKDYSQNIYIGKYGNSNNFLPGSINELRIYNRALSQTEVTSLYQQ